MAQPDATDTEKMPLGVTTSRFVRAVRSFASSEVGWKAKLMLSGLVLLLAGANGLNVINSYVGRNFMTAIADRNNAEFVRQAALYIGVFAASTVVAVVARFIEERLGLLWREFLTRRAVSRYLADGAYYHLEASERLTHPDQRIAEDIRAFTVTTLSFVLMALNSSFTVVSFSSVLWSISPLLFIVAVLYATCGSYLTIALGRPLITLSSDQLDKEAAFRAGLNHIRENAESIMLARREGRHKQRLLNQLDDLITNFGSITAVNRNVGFFTTGYNWLIQLIPALIIAPAFIKGSIAFGVITQSAMAFSTLVAAFSLIVTQFQSLSNFAAVVARLNSLMETIEQLQTATEPAIEIVEGEHLAYEKLTLQSSQGGNPLVKDLTVSIPSGAHLLINGPSQAGGAALFRATAGAWTAGTGRIVRPSLGKILFLPQRPYLPPGTLREVLAPTKLERSISDEQINAMLQALDLDAVLLRAGGLNTEQDWETLLSLGEQQLLAFIHIVLAAPHFVMLDRIGTVLNSGQVRKMLELLSGRSITYISIGEIEGIEDMHDAILELNEWGGWTWRQIRAGTVG